MEYNKDALKTLAHGACFMAAGGGGSLTTALNILDRFPDEQIVSSVPLKDALADSQGLTAVVAFIGSPDSAGSLSYPLLDAVAAFHNLNEKAKKYKGREITYLIPVEIGAVNTIVPFVVACYINGTTGKQIKIIDADGAGRSVPDLTMLTYSAVSCNPTILSKAPKKSNAVEDAAPRLNRFKPIIRAHPYKLDTSSSESISKSAYNVSIEIEDAGSAESLIRPIITNEIFGEVAGLATWLMDSDDLKKANTIEGTVTQAYNYGETLRLTNNTPSYLGTPIFTGIVTNIESQTAGGFDHSVATLKNEQDTFYIYIQNENIIGWSIAESKPVIMVPDLLCYLALEFQQPDGSPEKMRVFSNTAGDYSIFIKNKVQVTLLGRACDPKLREGSIASAFAELCQAIGYPGKYLPFDRTN